MALLSEVCTELFDTCDLYEILGVTRGAAQQDIKKAYRKKSLIYHPDRASREDQAAATRKFQVLSQVYSILSDDGLRAEYDETGNVGEGVPMDEDRDWQQYWRLLFPKITVKDIEDFSAKYQGSAEETEDLKKVYLSSRGDMTQIMNQMICSSFQDEARFVSLISALIQGGSLPDFPAFSKESKQKKTLRQKKAEKEAKEAEEEAKKMKLDDSQDSLMLAIAARQASRAAQADSFLSHLEAKYASGDKASKKRSAKSRKS